MFLVYIGLYNDERNSMHVSAMRESLFPFRPLSRFGHGLASYTLTTLMRHSQIASFIAGFSSRYMFSIRKGSLKVRRNRTWQSQFTVDVGDGNVKGRKRLFGKSLRNKQTHVGTARALTSGLGCFNLLWQQHFGTLSHRSLAGPLSTISELRP